MFERIEVWENAPDCIWVYIVFRDLQTGLFHVQQANALYRDDSMRVTRSLAAMGLSEPDLFQDKCPSKRSEGLSKVAAAVAHHKATFAGMIAVPQ